MAEKIGAGQVAPVMYDYGQEKFFLQDNDDLVNHLVVSDTDGVTKIVKLTQAEYNALTAVVDTTLYVIVEE